MIAAAVVGSTAVWQEPHPPSSRYGFRLILLVFGLVAAVGGLAQAGSIYLGLAFTEVGLILAPTLLAARLLVPRFDPAATDPVSLWRRLGWRRPGPSPLQGLAVGVGVGLLASGMAIGLTLPMLFLHLYLGARYPGLPLPLDTGRDFGMALVVGVGLAAVCEETLFRGFLLQSQRQAGRHAAVWITACCFGFLHMDPIRFIATTMLGAIFGYLAWATGSILPAVAAHAANNFMALSLAYFSGPDPADQPPLDWEGLLGEVTRQLEQIGGIGGLADERAALLVLLATSVGFLIGGAILAVVIGLILRILERRVGLESTPVEARPEALRALLKDPAAWGVGLVGTALIVTSLILQHRAAG